MIDDEALRTRDAERCKCGHKRVSHGSFSAKGQSVGIGHGPCGIDRDTRNALTGWLGDVCPCTAFARRPASQLWRLVAESTPRESVARYDLGYWLDRASERGPRICVVNSDARIGRHICPVNASNGIIRAGERVK